MELPHRAPPRASAAQGSVAHRAPGFSREAQRVAITCLSKSQKKSGGWVILKSVRKQQVPQLLQVTWLVMMMTEQQPEQQGRTAAWQATESVSPAGGCKGCIPSGPDMGWVSWGDPAGECEMQALPAGPCQHRHILISFSQCYRCGRQGKQEGQH